MAAESPGARPPDNLFSLEELDKVIEAADPNFKSEMAGIQTSGSADVQTEIQSLPIETEIGSQAQPKSQRSFKEKIAEFFASLRQRFILFFSRAKDFTRYELPERLRFWRTRAVSSVKTRALSAKRGYDRFVGLSRAEKAGLAFMLVALIFSFVILGQTFKGSRLPRFSDPLLHSLADEAFSVKTYKNKDDLQDLFHAFPEVEFHVLLGKVVVNLRPDENSGRNPMGAYQLYLGLDSKDTAMEVKDRERELLDIVQRALESFSYSEVSSTVGKVRMKSVVRERVNEVLNQGQVHHVYFNMFVTTP